MADPALHRSAGAPKHVAIGLEKYVSIKRTAERAVGVDRIPLDPEPSDLPNNALTIFRSREPQRGVGVDRISLDPKPSDQNALMISTIFHYFSRHVADVPARALSTSVHASSTARRVRLPVLIRGSKPHLRRAPERLDRKSVV